MNPYQNHTDTELVTRLNEGNRDAFAVIYDRYSGLLYAYVRKNITTKEDCQEIVQDIFESIWARHRTLQIETLQFYMLKMARYKVIHYFRHSAVKKKFAEHYKLFEAIYDTSSEPDRDASIVQEKLNKSIAELPDKWQTALRLRLYENLSNSDIAIRMNVSKKTVEWYMFEAFARIRASYKTQRS